MEDMSGLKSNDSLTRYSDRHNGRLPTTAIKDAPIEGKPFKDVLREHIDKEKQLYSITNEVDGESYVKSFYDKYEARHWIINTLDLSKEWSIYVQEKAKIEHIDIDIKIEKV